MVAIAYIRPFRASMRESVKIAARASMVVWVLVLKRCVGYHSVQMQLT